MRALRESVVVLAWQLLSKIEFITVTGHREACMSVLSPSRGKGIKWLRSFLSNFLSFTLSQICALAGVKTKIFKLVGKGMALPVFNFSVNFVPSKVAKPH